MAKVILGYVRNRLLLTVAELREALETLPDGHIVECTGMKDCWNWYNQKVKEAKEYGDVICEEEG